MSDAPYGLLAGEHLVGGYPWSRQITITLPDGTNDLVAAGWAGWSLMWRPSGGDNSSIDLAVDDTNAAAGVLVLSATGPDTAAMGGSGVAELRGELGGVAAPLLRVPFTWEQGVNR